MTEVTPTPRMYAMVQIEGGGPDVMRLTEVDRPTPTLTEVLVRVHAAGVNPTDWKTRARGRFGVGALPPFTVGYDVSGVVEAVGPGVTLLAPGDEVFGMPRFPHPAQTYAQYITSPTRHLVPKPAGIDHVTAAAVPLAALTAWQALVDTAGLRQGQRVLIHAAAGGVGHLAVQIAKSLGAQVIGTASSSNHAVLAEIGVDQAIDYRESDFAASVRDVDVVLDPIGGDTTLRSLGTLRPGGTLVSLQPMDQEFPAARAADLGVRATQLLVEPDQAGMLRVAELLAAGTIRPIIQQVFPLQQAAAAHALGEKGHVVGKLVLAVDEGGLS